MRSDLDAARGALNGMVLGVAVWAIVLIGFAAVL
jgi:hypothetical protein